MHPNCNKTAPAASASLKRAAHTHSMVVGMDTKKEMLVKLVEDRGVCKMVYSVWDKKSGRLYGKCLPSPTTIIRL